MGALDRMSHTTRTLRRLARRIRVLFTGSRFDRELEEEMRLHQTLRQERLLAAGLAEQEAQEIARRRFGSELRLREDSVDAWGWRWLEQLRRDVRLSLRSLRKNAGFACAAVLTLGCGIGATTAAFTQVYAVFLKDLPVRDPHELRALSYIDPVRPRAALAFSGDDYRHLRDSTTTFSDLACWLATDWQPLGERGSINVQLISANYLQTLGVAPVIGRSFTPEDDQVGAAPVALLSDRTWRRDFAADPDILNRTIRIQRQPFAIVGVLPRGFFGVAPEAPHDVMVPHALAPLIRPGAAFCQVFGRLRAGVTTSQGQADMERLFRVSPATPPAQSRAEFRLVLTVVEPGAGPAGLRERTAPSLGILMTISSLVLVIACANVAGLLLVRGSARIRELGTQLALGATRARIVRQLMTESLILALASGGVGVALAYAIEPLVPRFIAELGGVATLTGAPRALGIDLRPDARVLAFSIALTIGTALLFGVLPALRSSRADVVTLMRQSPTPTRQRRFGTGSAFTSVQVALSVLLLVGIGLFARTLVSLRTVPIGYQPEGMLFATLNPINRPRAFVDDAMRTMAALPGVQSVAASQWPLFNDAEPKLPVCILAREAQQHALDIEWATPRFFETWGVRFLDGGDFQGVDTPEAIVNGAFAARFLPGRQAVGQTIGIGECPGRPVTIVGVVDNHLDRPRVDVLPMVYLPYPAARAFNPTTIALRVSGDARALVPDVRRAISMLESSLMDGDVTTGVDYRNARIRRESLLTAVLTMFGAMALVTSCIGIYGTVAYAVARRTRELGIRTALGARWNRIVAAVLGQHIVAVSAGMIVGVSVALALSRLVVSFLFGVSPFDGWSVGAAMAVMTLSAAAAAARPALRAARLNPADTLRAE